MSHPSEGASGESRFNTLTVGSVQDVIVRDFVLPGYPEDLLEIADVKLVQSFYVPSVWCPRLTPV